MKGIKNLNQINIAEAVAFSREQLLELYWLQHPRYIFMKSVPYESKFLELGAGDGGISFWKDWLVPYRNDIKMFEVMEQGTIRNEFLAEQLVSYGFNHKHQELTTYGLWLLAEWSDYVVLRKN